MLTLTSRTPATMPAAPSTMAGSSWADGQFGVVNVQPGFDQSGSGLEASHKKAAGER